MTAFRSLPSRAQFAMVLGATALLAAASVATAQQGGGQTTGASEDIVSSNTGGSLLRPEDWSCDYLVGEWEDWVEDERPASEWRFAGRMYRDVADDELYSWEDWLDWYDESGCGAAVVDTTGGMSRAATYYGIGAAISVYGAAIIIDGNGTTDSPG